MLRDHAELLAQWFGERQGMKELRKHTGWYLQGFPVGRQVRNALHGVSTLDEAHRLLDGIDAHLPFPTEVLRVPRGHTGGPRPVSMPERWLDDLGSLVPPDAAADIAISGG